MSSLDFRQKHALYDIIEEIRRNCSEETIEFSLRDVQDYFSGRDLNASYNDIKESLEDITILKEGRGVKRDVKVFRRIKNRTRGRRTKGHGYPEVVYAASRDDWDMFYMLLNLRRA